MATRSKARKRKAIAFIAAETAEARAARDRLAARYGRVTPGKADVIVALGGDGFMLQTLHKFMDSGKPIYGMNCGSVGFLMNEFRATGLRGRIDAALTTVVHPLAMIATDRNGRKHTAYAINEVSLLRQSYQAAKLRIAIDGKIRMAELICDGILVATPAGSTAYNLSAHGPILPIYAPLLAITPISAFRPRTWRGALVPDRVEITIEMLESKKRPVNAVADNVEFKSVIQVVVKQELKAESLIMFDPDHSWDERILSEQFRY
ncbi:MAG: NAD kinase [Bauldia sp.]|uniref:NAD kinase n=1 Tax=Bauldia sp. TaxID=2575872 RepID=UPI001D859656|nr:NAD kinase [Bauldia sp.]MCB1487260.1 NAD kinase [Bauldia sp.]MCB1494951.1 NAD kinase [Bauldia sp.]